VDNSLLDNNELHNQNGGTTRHFKGGTGLRQGSLIPSPFYPNNGIPLKSTENSKYQFIIQTSSRVQEA